MKEQRENMKIQYLGTAAAEGWPAVFCNCEYCRKAKEKGGKNLRTRSQAIINNDLLIDFPTDSYAHMLKNGLDISAVKYLFVTHAHIDHFEPTDLLYYGESCYSHDMTEKELRIYGNEMVMERYKYYVTDRYDESVPSGIKAECIHPFQTVKAGGYEITALPANHDKRENCLVYLIKQGEKTILYLHDTGIPSEDFFDYLEKNRVVCDLISYDCTYGALKSSGGHLGLDRDIELRKRFEETGVSRKNTVSVVNHFSHNGMLIYDEMKETAEKLGFVTAYDGMSLEV